jgi:hypothetical protein
MRYEPSDYEQAAVRRSSRISHVAYHVRTTVASWDLGMKSQPVWTWPKGLRLSRFFSGVS